MTLEVEKITRMLEPAPQDVEERLAAVVPTGEQMLVRVSVDMSADGSCYGDSWVAMTAQRLIERHGQR